MVVDIESRLIMANKPDRQGLLKQEGNIYTGIYPENKTIARICHMFRDEA